jgi:putative serine protease PepD
MTRVSTAYARHQPIFVSLLPIVLAVATAACAGSGSSATLTPGGASAPIPSSVGDPAEALQNDFVAVVQRISPSVVQIQDSQGLGSGIVFDRQGDIVTNAHVVADATTFTVTFADGKTDSATLLDAYTPNDLAVIRVQGNGEGLSPAVFADSAKLQVGDVVLAIGNPLGLRSSVTEGIISAFRTGVSESNGSMLPSVIQTSAAINPGNSGGALVDLTGDVVGIPTLAASDPQLGGTAPGIGFAIPSNTVKDLATQIVQSGHVVNSHRAYLGVQVGASSGQGAVITGVVSGGPAANAGLTAGDVITSLGGAQVRTPGELTSVLAGLQPGQSVSVGISRPDGSTAAVTVTLGTYPGG